MNTTSSPYTNEGPPRPACTRDAGSRLSVRAAGEWLWWCNGFARSLGVSTALLVTKAIEEFARERGYKPPPQRYEKAKVFNRITGEWVDQLPYGYGQVGVAKPPAIEEPTPDEDPENEQAPGDQPT